MWDDILHLSFFLLVNAGHKVKKQRFWFSIPLSLPQVKNYHEAQNKTKQNKTAEFLIISLGYREKKSGDLRVQDPAENGMALVYP